MLFGASLGEFRSPCPSIAHDLPLTLMQTILSCLGAVRSHARGRQGVVKKTKKKVSREPPMRAQLSARVCGGGVC